MILYIRVLTVGIYQLSQFALCLRRLDNCLLPSCSWYSYLRSPRVIACRQAVTKPHQGRRILKLGWKENPILALIDGPTYHADEPFFPNHRTWIIRERLRKSTKAFRNAVIRRQAFIIHFFILSEFLSNASSWLCRQLYSVDNSWNSSGFVNGYADWQPRFLTNLLCCL